MEVLEKVPEQLWSTVADGCDYATYFHTPKWCQVVQKTYPHRYHIATRAFEFGKDDWIVLPMIESERELKGYFKRLNSNIFGVYGGLIATHPITAHRAQQIAKYLKHTRVKRIDIFGNPYAPPEADLHVG